MRCFLRFFSDFRGLRARSADGRAAFGNGRGPVKIPRLSRIRGPEGARECQRTASLR